MHGLHSTCLLDVSYIPSDSGSPTVPRGGWNPFRSKRTLADQFLSSNCSHISLIIHSRFVCKKTDIYIQLQHFTPVWPFQLIYQSLYLQCVLQRYIISVQSNNLANFFSSIRGRCTINKTSYCVYNKQYGYQSLASSLWWTRISAVYSVYWGRETCTCSYIVVA